MGYAEATGAGANATLAGVLARDRVITAVVLGKQNEDVAHVGRDIARTSPSTWWVVWVPDPQSLAELGQLTGGDPNIAVVVLDSSDRVTIRMSREEAIIPDQFLVAFAQAASA